MAILRVTVLFIFVSTYEGLVAFNVDEPMCTSRFDFEEKLLNKLVRMEHAMELLQERVSSELSAIKEEKLKIDQEFLTFKETLVTEQNDIKDNFGKISVKMEQERLKLVEDFKTMSQQYENKILRVSDDLTKALNTSSKLEKDFETMSDQNENRLKKISDDLAENLNKLLPTGKSVFAVQKAIGTLVGGVPTFSKVHVNVGNDYDVSTGKFTCKKDGLYLFTFGLRSISSKYVYCYIRLNEENVNYAITDGSYDMASVTVYLLLKTGDVVNPGSCGNWDSSNLDRVAAYFLGMNIG